MQWLREILQAKGIEVTDELIADVQKELPKYLVPKTEFNNKIAEIDNLKHKATILLFHLSLRFFLFLLYHFEYAL